MHNKQAIYRNFAVEFTTTHVKSSYITQGQIVTDIQRNYINIDEVISRRAISIDLQNFANPLITYLYCFISSRTPGDLPNLKQKMSNLVPGSARPPATPAGASTNPPSVRPSGAISGSRGRANLGTITGPPPGASAGPSAPSHTPSSTRPSTSFLSRAPSTHSSLTPPTPNPYPFTCHWPLCVKTAWGGKRYCQNHACTAHRFCQDGKSRISRGGKFSQFCDLHTCSVPDCAEIRMTSRDVPLVHDWNVEEYGLLGYAYLFFCRKHQCRAQGCREQILDRGSYCPAHGGARQYIEDIVGRQIQGTTRNRARGVGRGAPGWWSRDYSLRWY